MNFTNTRSSEINNTESWRKAFLEVDDAKHWKKGYSACSLAVHFSRPSVENSNGFNCLAHNLTTFGYSSVTFDRAEIEHESKFDVLGKGRMHDLVVWGTVNGNPLTVCVEAKVSESFGDTVEDTVAKRLSASPDSRIKERVENMIHLLDMDYADVQPLRYQLLTFLVGGIAEAKKTNGVLYLPVFVYKSSVYDNDKGDRNLHDFIKFMDKVGFGWSDSGCFDKFSKVIDGIPVLSSYVEVTDF